MGRWRAAPAPLCDEELTHPHTLSLSLSVGSTEAGSHTSRLKFHYRETPKHRNIKTVKSNGLNCLWFEFWMDLYV